MAGRGRPLGVRLEQCPEHPLSAAMARIAELEAALREIRGHDVPIAVRRIAAAALKGGDDE